MEIESIQNMAQHMQNILGLSASVIGVSFLTEAPNPAMAMPLSQHRFCQALMRARHGEIVSLDSEGMACPAAAAAFGFRPLPAGAEERQRPGGVWYCARSGRGAENVCRHAPTLTRTDPKPAHLPPLQKRRLCQMSSWSKMKRKN
jgi:uncharacterized protein (DUF169 family)